MTARIDDEAKACVIIKSNVILLLFDIFRIIINN